jgi:hypothetical protein
MPVSNFTGTSLQGLVEEECTPWIEESQIK